MSSALVAVVLVVVGGSVGGALLNAEDSLVHARTLYEAANYEEALALLDSLDQSAQTSEDGQAVRRYRALCLLALDRTSDAQRVSEQIVRNEPTAAVDPDLPPRLRAMLTSAREQIIPGLIQQQYQRGHELFDKSDMAGAARVLSTVVTLVDDPSLGLTTNPTFADLRVLASGFLQLARMAQPSPPAVASSPSARLPLPAETSARDAHSSASAAGSPVPAPAHSPAALLPPRALVQHVPPFPQRIPAQFVSRREGELEVQIGADGSVQAAKVILSIHPAYDPILIEAAKASWRYQPATRLGVPVPYTQRVRVVLQSP